MIICHVALARVAEELLSRGDSPLAVGYLELLSLLASETHSPRLQQILRDEQARRAQSVMREKHGSR